MHRDQTIDVDALSEDSASHVSRASPPAEDAQTTTRFATVIDLTNSSPAREIGPSDEIVRAMKNIHGIRQLDFDHDEIQELVIKILNRLECIPLVPSLPPRTQDHWSDIVQLAKLHHVDNEWLQERMMRWIFHILQVSSVPLEHLAVTIRATRNLLNVVEPVFRTKVYEEIEVRFLIWWTNVVQPGTSREHYNRAWCLLGELVDLHEIAPKDADKIEMHWKEIYRCHPVDDN